MSVKKCREQGGLEGRTDHSLEVDKAKPLAYVVADHDQVRLEETPALGAGRIVELESIVSLAEAYFKYEGLIDILEKSYIGLSIQLVSTLAYPPLHMLVELPHRISRGGAPYERNVDFPTFSSPSNRMEIFCGSMLSLLKKLLVGCCCCRVYGRRDSTRTLLSISQLLNGAKPQHTHKPHPTSLKFPNSLTILNFSNSNSGVSDDSV